MLICPLEEPYSSVALKAIYLWTVFCSPSSFPNLYGHLYSQHLLPHYPNHLISYFLLVWFPLALLLTPLSSLLPSKALGIWSCAQMFASCESSTVSQVVSGSRCSDVSLPPSLPLRLCFLYKHQIAMMLFFLSREYPIHDLQLGCATTFLETGERQHEAFTGHDWISYFCHCCRRISDRNNLGERRFHFHA